MHPNAPPNPCGVPRVGFPCPHPGTRPPPHLHAVQRAPISSQSAPSLSSEPVTGRTGGQRGQSGHSPLGNPGLGVPLAWPGAGRGRDRNREGFSSFTFRPRETLGGSWLRAGGGPRGGPELHPLPLGTSWGAERGLSPHCSPIPSHPSAGGFVQALTPSSFPTHPAPAPWWPPRCPDPHGVGVTFWGAEGKFGATQGGAARKRKHPVMGCPGAAPPSSSSPPLVSKTLEISSPSWLPPNPGTPLLPPLRFWHWGTLRIAGRGGPKTQPAPPESSLLFASLSSSPPRASLRPILWPR